MAPAVMTWPMILLAVGSVFSGFLLWWGGSLQRWLEPVVGVREEAAHALPGPKELGLDAAVPAAFLALLAPRLVSRRLWLVATTAAATGLVSVPFVPAGVPVLLGALVAVVMGARPPPPGGATGGSG